MELRAEFVTSAFSLRECPVWDRIEIAFAGRSNVGKSSLLNAIAANRRLARVGKTPGSTRAINFFAVGDALALVDLPGYGYARIERRQAEVLGAAMRDYLERRRNLNALVLLIDSRRGPGEEETALAAIARARSLRLIVVATKCDKLGRSARARALAAFASITREPVFCSGLSGEGIEQVRRSILRIEREHIQVAGPTRRARALVHPWGPRSA